MSTVDNSPNKWFTVPKRASVVLAIQILLVSITFGFPALFGQKDVLFRMFCKTGTSSLLVIWLIVIMPRKIYAFAATILVVLTGVCVYVVVEADLGWRFSALAGALIAIMTFLCCLIGMRIRSGGTTLANHQFSLRGMMALMAVVAVFIQAKLFTALLSDRLGWEVCNIVLFSVCDAGLSFGLFYAILRFRYLIVSILLSAIVVIGITALAIYWLPEEQFSDRWGMWWLIGHQFLIHVGYVFIPVLAARLLGFRIDFEPGRSPANGI